MGYYTTAMAVGNRLSEIDEDLILGLRSFRYENREDIMANASFMDSFHAALNQAEATQKRFLDFFKVSSMEELQNKLTYAIENTKGLNMLHGRQMEINFIEPSQAYESLDVKEFKTIFQPAIIAALNALESSTQAIQNETKIMSYDFVMNLLLSSFSAGYSTQSSNFETAQHRRFWSEKGWKGHLNVKNSNGNKDWNSLFEDIAFNELTSQQKKAMFLFNQKLKQGNIEFTLKDYNIDIKIEKAGNGSVTATIVPSLSQITGGHRWTDRNINMSNITLPKTKNIEGKEINIKDLFDYNSPDFDLDTFNDIKAQVGTYIQGVTQNEDIAKIAMEVFEESPSGFFQGKNIRFGYGGILGEIAGIYFFRSILKDKSISGVDVKSVGNTMVNSKKPHADIMVTTGKELGINVQVKNSVIDYDNWLNTADMDAFIKEMSFANFSLDSFFDVLEDLGSLSRGSLDRSKYEGCINDLYLMHSFNIDISQHTKGRDFSPLRAWIERTVNKMDWVFARLVDIYMYMQTDRFTAMAIDKMKLNNKEHLGSLPSGASANYGNTIYLFGGSLIISGFQIMQQLYSQIQKVKEIIQPCSIRIRQNLKSDSKKGKGGGYTYRDYIQWKKENKLGLKSNPIPSSWGSNIKDYSAYYMPNKSSY